MSKAWEALEEYDSKMASHIMKKVILDTDMPEQQHQQDEQPSTSTARTFGRNEMGERSIQVVFPNQHVMFTPAQLVVNGQVQNVKVLQSAASSKTGKRGLKSLMEEVEEKLLKTDN